jgi:hypothetical protein
MSRRPFDSGEPKTDVAIVSAWRRAMARRGRMVRIQRLNGAAPRAATFSADVLAIVMGDEDDVRASARTGFDASKPGAITENLRTVSVLEDDLIAKRFPLPLRKGDRVVLIGKPDKLTVENVDDEKGRIGGVIELKASGTS